MFGSLFLPGEWPEEYGIETPMPDALVDQLVHPLFPPTAPACDRAESAAQPLPAADCQ
jgi:hypothetical protein